MKRKWLFSVPLCLCGLWLLSPAAAVRIHAQTPKIAPMHVHHVHLNSVNPAAAAAYYPKPFAATATKTTFNGYEAVKTGNVYLLFTKVAMPPQNELTGPQTSVWHFGWNTPDSRKYDERFRAMGLEIAQMSSRCAPRASSRRGRAASATCADPTAS